MSFPSFSRLNHKVPLYVAGYEKALSYRATGYTWQYLGSSIKRRYEAKKQTIERAADVRSDIIDSGIVGGADQAGWIQQYILPELHQMEATKRRAERDRAYPKSKRGEHVHVLSTRSAERIREKLHAFFDATEGGNTFCTLTFINTVDDRTAVKTLNKFLTVLRRETKELQYLWVAERQETGNIHFHTMLNQRIDVKRYNNLWVLQQYNSGIVHPGYDYATVKQHYDAGTVQRILNPLDIKKVSSIDGLSLYLTKYVTKQRTKGAKKDLTPDELKEKGFECRTWHCTRGVSELFTRAIITARSYADYSGVENTYVDKETGELFEPLIVKNDYATVIYVRNKQHFKKKLARMCGINRKILKGDKLDSSIMMFDGATYYQNYIYECTKEEIEGIKGAGLPKVFRDQLRDCKEMA